MGNIQFVAHDLMIMEDPCVCLNDVCLNSVAKYLHTITSHPSNPAHSHSQRCTLFSTYDLLMICYNATEDEVWRRTHKMEYWSKDIWILPIHRTRPAKHWVQCTISLNTRKLLLFDSFAAVQPWKHEVTVSILRCALFAAEDVLFRKLCVL
jgi:Ulp1 family protease